MVKKTLSPKVLIHLSIDPELKRFLVEHNINASELLEKSIMELVEITKQEDKEDPMEYYEDIKKRLKGDGVLNAKIKFTDRAFFREEQIRAMNILRHKLGFNFEDAKRILEKYVEDMRRETEEEEEEENRNRYIVF